MTIAESSLELQIPDAEARVRRAANISPLCAKVVRIDRSA